MIIKQFKVYPDAGWCWIEVFIHRTKKDMHQHVDRTGGGVIGNYAGLSRGGWSVWIHKNGSETLTGRIGEIHLYRGALGAGTVSHEATHHTFRYFQFRSRFKLPRFSRKSGVNVSEQEENFCWVVGSITNQIYRQWWAKTKRQLKLDFECPFQKIKRKRRFDR